MAPPSVLLRATSASFTSAPKFDLHITTYGVYTATVSPSTLQRGSTLPDHLTASISVHGLVVPEPVQSSSACWCLCCDDDGCCRCGARAEHKCLNSELWHACAGSLVSLPAIDSRVMYFPQGHGVEMDHLHLV
uniref:Uncharacterized protein n=1 Tax=Zea mays TaxID=4577 RepID=A0A804N5F8_MAIZE